MVVCEHDLEQKIKDKEADGDQRPLFQVWLLSDAEWGLEKNTHFTRNRLFLYLRIQFILSSFIS